MQGIAHHRRRGLEIAIASPFEHASGRQEFAPARLVSSSSGTRLEILGRGGSARLRPLIEADGLAEVDAATGCLRPGDIVSFHPFRGAFSV
jgi:molybdopterin molybdotransferase